MSNSGKELCRYAFLACLIPILLVLATVPWAGNDPNDCDEPGEYPDVIVGSLYQKTRYTSVGGITAFAIGTYSCNSGTCWLDWFADPSNEHPVITQDMFRLKDDKFEHIGQAWVKHGFLALSNNLCFNDCIPTNGQHLGVHCSDPYSAGLNGIQTGLGPKFEVNAATGYHPHPVTDINLTGNSIFKRMQVHNVDLDPDLNPEARYFVESQYVAEDETIAGYQYNSASYREVDVFGAGDFFDFNLIGDTVREEPAISAWAAIDPEVDQINVDVPGDGRFIVASKVSDAGGGVWHYEYAIRNFNSDRAARSFSVPIPFEASPGQIGFHDVDYHSGEPWDGTDWNVTVGSNSITWETQSAAVNPNANALRWATTYNFRFDLNSAPVNGDATLGLFLPGSPGEILVSTNIPLLCNNNSVCDPGEMCACLEDCPGDGPDDDGDLVGVCVDCDDDNIAIWTTPGPTQDLQLEHESLTGTTTLTWSPPADPGATVVEYETLRSSNPAVFTGPIVTCMQESDPTNTWLTDSQPMPAGRLYCYLVRATNDCPVGDGSLGVDSNDKERDGRSCS